MTINQGQSLRSREGESEKERKEEIEEREARVDLTSDISFLSA